MENKKQDLLDESTVITRETVQRIGEILALVVIRYASSQATTISIGSTTVFFGI